MVIEKRTVTNTYCDSGYHIADQVSFQVVLRDQIEHGEQLEYVERVIVTQASFSAF